MRDNHHLKYIKFNDNTFDNRSFFTYKVLCNEYKAAPMNHIMLLPHFSKRVIFYITYNFYLPPDLTVLFVQQVCNTVNAAVIKNITIATDFGD